MKNYSKIGLQNEDDIINYLNYKKVGDLNFKWKSHILTMFSFANDNDIIYCRKFPDHKAKPDIIIKIRHTLRYVSIKSGKNPSIHQEDFFSFGRFLSSISVNSKTLRTIRFYHFGETDKLNNNGRPFTKDEMMEQYSVFFKNANIDLDKKNIIEEVINRAVIRGADKRRTAIDYLYYGSLQEGFLLSKEDIYTSVLSHREHENRPIHFGALNYQPAGRKRTTIDYRYVRIKWPLLCIMFYENKNTSKAD